MLISCLFVSYDYWFYWKIIHIHKFLSFFIHLLCKDTIEKKGFSVLFATTTTTTEKCCKRLSCRHKIISKHNNGRQKKVEITCCYLDKWIVELGWCLPVFVRPMHFCWMIEKYVDFLSLYLALFLDRSIPNQKWKQKIHDENWRSISIQTIW